MRRSVYAFLLAALVTPAHAADGNGPWADYARRRWDASSTWLHGHAFPLPKPNLTVPEVAMPPFGDWLRTSSAWFPRWTTVSHGAARAIAVTWTARHYPVDATAWSAARVRAGSEWILENAPPDVLDMAVAAGTVMVATYACTYMVASDTCKRTVPRVGLMALRQGYRLAGRPSGMAVERGAALGGDMGAGGLTGLGISPLLALMDRWDNAGVDAVPNPLTVRPVRGRGTR